MTCQVLCIWIAIQNIYTNKKQLTTMAEIIENKMDHHDVPSMGKANAGLTLG